METLPTIAEVAGTRWKLVLLLNQRLGAFLDMRRKLREVLDPSVALDAEERIAAARRIIKQVP